MMNRQTLMRLTGGLLMAGAVLVNVPYTLLILNFEYPDILREPAGYVLTQFQAGGAGLIWTWFAFAWIGLPLLPAVILLPRVLKAQEAPLMTLATWAGAISLVAQIVGLLRWVFVVPVLARIYTDPASTEMARAAAEVTFEAVHHLGGVLLGEHIGQLFIITWMLLVSLYVLRSGALARWMAWLGIAASAVYALAQTELLAVVLPGFFVVPEAGLIGSLLWLLWVIVLGVLLILSSRTAAE